METKTPDVTETPGASTDKMSQINQDCKKYSTVEINYTSARHHLLPISAHQCQECRFANLPALLPFTAWEATANRPRITDQHHVNLWVQWWDHTTRHRHFPTCQCGDLLALIVYKAQVSYDVTVGILVQVSILHALTGAEKESGLNGFWAWVVICHTTFLHLGMA